MPTFRRIRRSIAAILLALYLPGCHHYVTPKGMTPEAYIAAEQPKQVRVTLQDGTRQTILDPFTSHDSLLGYIPVRQSNSFVRSGPLWAASLASVRRLEVQRLNVATTVVGLTSLPGQRVRVTAPAEELARQEGTFERLQGDSALIVSIEGESQVVPLAAVTKLECVNGHRHHAAGGLGIGAAFGAVAGGLAGYAAGEDQCGGCGWGLCFCVTREGGAVLGAAGGAVAGGLIGLVMGAFYATDRWSEVPLDQLISARARVPEKERGRD